VPLTQFPKGGISNSILFTGSIKFFYKTLLINQTITMRLNLPGGIENDVIIQPLTFSYGLQFDGVNDFVGGYPYLNGWDLNQDNTIEVWIKDFGNNPTNNIAQIVFHSYSRMTIVNNTQLQWGGTRDNNIVQSITINWPVSVVKTQWTHLVFRYKAITRLREIFINSTLVASDTMASNFNAIGSNVGIGAVQGGTSSFYKGSMDDFRAYQRWLPDVEIAYSYNSGDGRLPQNQTSLLIWLNFENQTNNLGSSGDVAPMFNFSNYPFVTRSPI
jgi:hypothetical protein